MEPGALWVKRDDLTGLGGGGNKARKLDYLCADAQAVGADVLVTGGGPQSNHVRMTAAAANRLGLDCSVVMAGPRPTVSTGNVVLVELFGPRVEWIGLNEGPMDYYGIETAIDETADRLAAQGRRPYRMPIGGASAVGALGYVHAAAELRGQAAGSPGPSGPLSGSLGPSGPVGGSLGPSGPVSGSLGPSGPVSGVMGGIDVVVVAAGSGGTHAGLAAGLGDLGLVLGVDVGARPDLDTQIPAKAAEVASLAGLPAPQGQVRIDHERVGDGYGAATEECRQAVLLAARTEGLILDPVYTGKAMAGLVAARRKGVIGPGDRTVFVHTGGMPALFSGAYATWGRNA